MSILMFPENVGEYESGRSDMQLNMEEDLKAFWVEISEAESDAIMQVVKRDVFALLPEWFSGWFHPEKPDIFRLSTTRHHQKI